MSVTRLLLSGLLVASGLILAAFALNGYLDPRWTPRQIEAAGARAPALRPWSTRIVREKAAARAKASARKTEKSKPQQASFQWPWSWAAE